MPEVRRDEYPDADPGAAFSPPFELSHVLEGMDVWTVGCSRNIVRSAFLFRSLPLIGSNVSLLLPGKAARLSPIIDCAPEPRMTRREHARHRRVIGEYRNRDAPRSADPSLAGLSFR